MVKFLRSVKIWREWREWRVENGFWVYGTLIKKTLSEVIENGF